MFAIKSFISESKPRSAGTKPCFFGTKSRSFETKLFSAISKPRSAGIEPYFFESWPFGFEPNPASLAENAVALK
jgi:hypothetical protein